MSEVRPSKKKRRRERRELPLIGWREWVALPELGIDGIKAKIDTGARSSALHAYDYEEYERAGRSFLRFKVHPLQRDTHLEVAARAAVLERRAVRNSGGRSEVRWVIETDVLLFGERFPIELTLTRRDAMGFRMLLGRQAVRGRFLVDPGRSFLGGRKKGKGPR